MAGKDSAATTTRAANGSSKTEKDKADKDKLVYLDDYLDTIESLPAELQRSFSLMRELDAKSQDALDAVAVKSAFLLDHLQDLTPQQRMEELSVLANHLDESLKNGEEKVAIASCMYDTVDRHIRRLDDDLQRFEDVAMTGPGRVTAPVAAIPAQESSRKAVQKDRDKKDGRHDKNSRHGHHDANKRRKTHKSDAATPPPSLSRGNGEKDREKKHAKARKETSKGQKKTGKTMVDQTTDMPIDPNEPTYCYCNQVSWGEMVACDNAECEIEWFHYACVGLKSPPKGKWYCTECSEKLKIRTKK